MNRFTYVWWLGGLALSLLIFTLGITRNQTLVTVLGLAGILLFGFLIALLVTINSRATITTNIKSVEHLYNLSQTRSTDKLAAIDIGHRWPAITLSRHLTSGRMIVIDIYNPQLMPAKTLMRTQQQNYSTSPSDPRLSWYDSNLDLLPLPDRSVSAVFIYHVLSEIAEKGDQKTLLKEIARILQPGGRLLITEFSNIGINRLRASLGIIHMQPYEYWRNLLEEAGYKIQQAQSMPGGTINIRADNPLPYAGSQMSLDLDFEAY